MRHDPNTLDLFHDQPPAQVHSETSRAAAQSVVDKVPKLEAEVLAFIRSQDARGATDEEILDDASARKGSQQNASTWRPRRVWLCGEEGVRKPLIVDSGLRRKGRSQRNMTVWIAVEFANGPR